MTQDSDKACLACRQTSQEVPLLALEYRGTQTWICPQHLPVLIHHPQRLAELLPGAAGLDGAEDCE